MLQASGLVVLPIYANYLSPAEFGVLDILDRIGMILLVGLMANGFRMATLTFFRQAETEADRERVSITVSTALFGTVFIGLVVAACSSSSLSQWLGMDDEWLLLFGIATGLAEAILIIPMALMQARLQSSEFVSLSICMFLTRLASLLFFVVFLGCGLWGILIARLINSVIFGAWLYGKEFQRATVWPDMKTFKEVFWFSLPFLPGGLLAFFIGFGDRFFLIKHSGEYELGLYAMCCRLVGFIPALSVGPIYKVWSAMMYDEAKKKNADQIFGTVFSRTMFCYLFIAFGLSLFAGDLLYVLGAEEYLPALVVLVPLIICGFLGKSADLMDAAFYIERKTKYKPWILFAVGVAALASYWTLIPVYGIYGAAWGTAISKLVHLVLTFVMTQKIFPVKYQWQRMGTLVTTATLLYGVSQTYSDHAFRFVFDSLLVFVLMAISWAMATDDERQMVVATVRKQFQRFNKLQKALGMER